MKDALSNLNAQKGKADLPVKLFKTQLHKNLVYLSNQFCSMFFKLHEH